LQDTGKRLHSYLKCSKKKITAGYASRPGRLIRSGVYLPIETALYTTASLKKHFLKLVFWLTAMPHILSTYIFVLKNKYDECDN
jgi:hypothetical protein